MWSLFSNLCSFSFSQFRISFPIGTRRRFIPFLARLATRLASFDVNSFFVYSGIWIFYSLKISSTACHFSEISFWLRNSFGLSVFIVAVHTVYGWHAHIISFLYGHWTPLLASRLFIFSFICVYLEAQICDYDRSAFFSICLWRGVQWICFFMFWSYYIHFCRSVSVFLWVKIATILFFCDEPQLCFTHFWSHTYVHKSNEQPIFSVHVAQGLVFTFESILLRICSFCLSWHPNVF